MKLHNYFRFVVYIRVCVCVCVCARARVVHVYECLYV